MEEIVSPSNSKRSTILLATREALSLVTLCVAAVFFFVMAYGFYTYCKWSIPLALSLASAVACVIPLVLFFPERLALLLRYCGGLRTAEWILRRSLSTWQSIAGQSGPGTTGKMSSLAQFLIETGRAQEAENLYAIVLQRLSTGGWKYPGRAEASLNSYSLFLREQKREEECAGVTVALSRLRKQSLGPKIALLLIPLPVVVYLSCTEVLVRAIAVELSQDHTSAVRNYVKILATGDSCFFGAGTGARVYSDYASSLYDSPFHQSTVLSFARAGLVQLGDKSPYLSSKLHTIIGTVQMHQGEDKKAVESLRTAVELGLLPAQFDRYDNNDHERRHLINAMTWLGDLELQRGNSSGAESMYANAMRRLEKLNASKSDEYLGLLDRFSALKSSQGAFTKAAAAKKDICDILESRLIGVTASNMTADEIEQHRRFTREMEACSVLLKQSGQLHDAGTLARRAEELRTQRVRPLLLNSQQQMEIVDATTRATEHLLSVKYKSAGWQKNLDLLMASDMKSNRARGTLDGLSWLSPRTNDNAMYVRRIEIDMQPMKVRNFREPNTLAVDVTGTVRIQRRSGADDEPFAFAYLLKRSGQGPPVIEGVAEN
ncbi:MAG: hypothetical protein K2W95_21040 [Candidatus Obscuribacterales bacterium]|nr:hypothetical protein [Candidatus Obscuribacterales bacterium]